MKGNKAYFFHFINSNDMLDFLYYKSFTGILVCFNVNMANVMIIYPDDTIKVYSVNDWKGNESDKFYPINGGEFNVRLIRIYNL
jgi:hypothetical protein